MRSHTIHHLRILRSLLQPDLIHHGLLISSSRNHHNQPSKNEHPHRWLSVAFRPKILLGSSIHCRNRQDASQYTIHQHIGLVQIHRFRNQVALHRNNIVQIHFHRMPRNPWSLMRSIYIHHYSSLQYHLVLCHLVASNQNHLPLSCTSRDGLLWHFGNVGSHSIHLRIHNLSCISHQDDLGFQDFKVVYDSLPFVLSSRFHCKCLKFHAHHHCKIALCIVMVPQLGSILLLALLRFHLLPWCQSSTNFRCSRIWNHFYFHIRVGHCTS